MINKVIKDRMYIMRTLSDIHSIAILQELYAANAPIPHRTLTDAVLVIQKETVNMQGSIRELQRIGIVEALESKEHIVEYRLNPAMDDFCRELVALIFNGVKVVGAEAPPDNAHLKTKPYPEPPAPYEHTLPSEIAKEKQP